jgi:hypothetical protein
MASMRRPPFLRPFTPAAVIALFLLGSCGDLGLEEQMEMCQSQLADSPAMLMIGTEGMAEVCRCTVDSLAVRFPDAGARWLAYQAELETRMQTRGMLGLVLDTAWANTRGKEMGEFAAAQAGIVGACTARLFPQ